MIFPGDLAKLILQGRKSATIRSKQGKCPYKPGHDYALQAGKRRLEQRVTVQDVKPTTVAELDLPTARKLGFRTRTELYERWNGSDDVWLITFVLGVHTDTPRLLAKKCGGHAGDYVSSASQALNETSEEVSAAVQSRFAAEAKVNLALAHSVPREALLEAVEVMRRQTGNAKHRRRWRSIEHQLSMMQREAS